MNGPGGSSAVSWTPAGSDPGRTLPALARARPDVGPVRGGASVRHAGLIHLMSGPRAEIYKKVTLGGPRDVRPPKTDRESRCGAWAESRSGPACGATGSWRTEA